MSDVKKILVVHDEPDIREIVAIMLEEGGYDVATTGDGVVETVQNDRIDLVVLDLGLPGIDGLTLTRAPKEHADVGVIIISGRGESTEKIIGLEIGADDYLGKPFEPRELLARVRRCSNDWINRRLNPQLPGVALFSLRTGRWMWWSSP